MGGKSVSHKTHRVSFDDVALLLLFGRGLLTRPFDRISMGGARDWHRMFLVLLGVGWKHTFLILLGVGWKRTFLTWFGVGWKVTFSHCWELSGGKSIFPYCWEGHFLILLGIVGHFSHIVGSQVRVESHFSHVVANWWKVAFLILLEVKARSGKSLFACWASSGKSPFLIIFRSGGAQRQREGGNSLPTPNNMRKVLMGIRFFLAFLILLGVEGEFPPLSLG